jgi:hypothetical protein
LVVNARNFSVYVIVSQDVEVMSIKDAPMLRAPMLKAISLRSVDPSWDVDPSKNPVIITLNANGGIFSDSSDIVNLNYRHYTKIETKYSHTPNYTDGNPNTSTYASTGKTETIALSGANNLSVWVLYDLGHSDGLFSFLGAWTDYLTIFR